MGWFSLKTVISLKAWLSLSWPSGEMRLRLFEFGTCGLLRRVIIVLIELFFYFLIILVVIFIVDPVIYHILVIPYRFLLPYVRCVVPWIIPFGNLSASVVDVVLHFFIITVCIILSKCRLIWNIFNHFQILVSI
jgi:hypothetical protein